MAGGSPSRSGLTISFHFETSSGARPPSGFGFAPSVVVGHFRVAGRRLALARVRSVDYGVDVFLAGRAAADGLEIPGDIGSQPGFRLGRRVAKAVEQARALDQLRAVHCAPPRGTNACR